MARNTSGTTMAATSLGMDRPDEGVEGGVELEIAAGVGVWFDKTGGDVVDGVRDMVNVFESMTMLE